MNNPFPRSVQNQFPGQAPPAQILLAVYAVGVENILSQDGVLRSGWMPAVIKHKIVTNQNQGSIFEQLWQQHLTSVN